MQEEGDRTVIVDLQQLERLLPPEFYQLVLANSSPARRPPATAILLNTISGFGVMAVAVATVALVPFPAVALLVGGLIWAAGVTLTHAGPKQWQLLAFMCTTIGGLISAGGLVWAEEDITSLLAVTALYDLTAVTCKSSLMSALATLTFAAWLGSSAFYCGK